MNIGGILLCRMDSERLPGKVLEPVGSVSLLELVVKRLRSVAVLHDKLVLATTDRRLDDPLAEFAREQDLLLFRGSVHNVAHRVLKCAERFQLDAFLRINGDSPWLDPQLIETGIQAMCRGNWQLVTNLRPRSFPYGVSLELIRTEYFSHAYCKMSAPGHFEHVTKYLYEQLAEGDFHNIRRQGLPSTDITRLRMSVDTLEDLQVLCQISQQYGDRLDRLAWQTVLPYYQRAAEARRAA